MSSSGEKSVGPVLFDLCRGGVSQKSRIFRISQVAPGSEFFVEMGRGVAMKSQMVMGRMGPMKSQMGLSWHAIELS